MQTHVMIDLETLSTEPNAAIIAIGAVKFDQAEPANMDRFYCPITVASNIERKRHISASTLEWWMSKDQAEPWDMYMRSERQHIAVALDGFFDWFGPDSLPTWGNGATFDNVILADAFRQAGLRHPWSYKHDRCYRTVCNMAPSVELKREGMYHNAVDDAQTQAMHLRKVASHLNLLLL